MRLPRIRPAIFPTMTFENMLIAYSRSLSLWLSVSLSLCFSISLLLFLFLSLALSLSLSFSLSLFLALSLSLSLSSDCVLSKTPFFLYLERGNAQDFQTIRSVGGCSKAPTPR